MRVFSVLAAGLAHLFLSAAAAVPLPAQAEARAEVFATCEGRYRAMAVRAFAYQEDGAEGHRHMQAAFQSLLTATLPETADLPARQPVRWSAMGWREVAFLLAAGDRAEAGARARLEAAIADCARLVL